MRTERARIGLALSGGGFRAVAFGLGCMTALSQHNLLPQVRVVSGISGGALLAAMWAYGTGSFDEFRQSVVVLLEKGLRTSLIHRAFTPSRLVRDTTAAAQSLFARRLRQSSRTDALIDVLMATQFGRKTMPDVTIRDLSLVISATDLVTSNAVRFGSKVSSSSPYGRISEPVLVAEAVAASAAFPLLLPAITRQFTFVGLDGTIRRERIVLTDGGVYENLGLSPLLPGRSTAYTSHVYDLNHIIAIDAGRARSSKPPPTFLFGRLARCFEITYNKAQDAGRTQLHELRRSGQLDGVVHCYLGMHDDRFPHHNQSLVPRDRVNNYPTSFNAVAHEDIDALVLRGEQLTRALLREYTPDLL